MQQKTKKISHWTSHANHNNCLCVIMCKEINFHNFLTVHTIGLTQEHVPQGPLSTPFNTPWVRITSWVRVGELVEAILVS